MLLHLVHVFDDNMKFAIACKLKPLPPQAVGWLSKV